MQRNYPPTGDIQPELVDCALRELTQYTGAEYDIDTWQVTKMERQQSVVYRLASDHTGTNSVILFYKVARDSPLHSRIGQGGHPSTHYSRTKRLTDNFLASTRALPIMAAPVLVADAESRTIITLGVPGNPLGRLIIPPLVRSKKVGYTRRFELMGRGAHHIELASRDEDISFDVAWFWSHVDKHLEVANLNDSNASGRFRSWLASLLDAALEDGEPIYAHGDLSSSNILVSRQSISLIDFRWVARLKCFDLAVLSYRVRMASPFWPVWRSRITDALARGYLNETPNTSTAAWRLADAQMLLRALAAPGPDIRSHAMRVLHRTLLNGPEEHGRRMAQDGVARPLWWWERG